MSQTNKSTKSTKWRMEDWLRRHFTDPFFDAYSVLLALSERTIWTLRNSLNQMVTFTRRPAARRSAKPRYTNLVPQVELLEVRYLPSISWTGGGSDNHWSTGANWSGGVAPGSGDTADLGSSAPTVVLDTGVTIANLIISTGTLDTNGNTLAITGSSSQWSGGTISNGGTLNVSFGNITISSAVTLDDVQIYDQGTTTWTGGNITLNHGASIIVMGGTFDIQSNAQLLSGGTGTNYVTNSGGTIQKSSGSGTTDISVDLSSAGLDVESGSLNFSGGALSLSGGTITGTTLGGASVTVGSGVTATVDGVAITAGTVDIAGTLDVEGTSNWSGGTISVSGTIAVQSGATLNITGTASLSFSSPASFDNFGTVNWAEGDIAIDDAAFVNEDGATFIMVDGVDLTDASVDSTFSNYGTLIIGGGNVAGRNELAVDYYQGSSGILAVEVKQTSDSAYDRLVIDGTASLDGVLQVRPLSGLSVSTGDTFPVLTASSISGTFASSDVTGFNRWVTTTYDSTHANVVIGSLVDLSTSAPTSTQQVIGKGVASLLSGNLHIDVATAQDYTPLEQDVLYYYAGLEYNSDTSKPQALISVKVPTDGGDPTLTDIKARLTWGGSTQSWVTFGMPGGSTPGDTYDLTLQVGSAIASTGFYNFSVDIQRDYASSSTVETYGGRTFVVVNGNTPYGNGWSLSDENHLYFDTVSENAYLVHGDGGYTIFTPTSGDTITSATWSSGTATITASNDFVAGETVVVNGVTSSGRGSFNGVFTVVSASSTQFTYSLTDDPGTASAYGVAATSFTFQSSTATYGGLSYESGTLSESSGIYVFTAADQLQWKFDGSSGLLTKVVDPVGVTVVYSYDGS
ncbi:MAG TPA: hypothetical protein VFE62_03625, partial [Gemmataceae bacterium]|nr:hypothetical protein [Gemmataceae bacterium]